ncbi:hypothetical protein CBR_g19867 [Chara braunii]|uniref:EF-hand domain-containing protein n=1 Tax=Chara braunii TaxID=69332 RepID=A0A388KYW5_CHABU|nr:hypothetical protein CBR_g19867 [Chara braunii]|eukprot:GBG75231.1 hypothetical protein CBR_g19867 [Chara braunii]
MTEGADVLDEAVCGTGLAEVAKLFELVVNGFQGAEGGSEKFGPLEEGVTWSSRGSAVADFSHPPFGGIAEEAGGGNGEPVGKGHVVEVKRVLELGGVLDAPDEGGGGGNGTMVEVEGLMDVVVEVVGVEEVGGGVLLEAAVEEGVVCTVEVGVFCAVEEGVVCAVVTTVMEGMVPSIVVTRSHMNDMLAFMSSREAMTEVRRVLSAWRMAERSRVAVFAGGCSPARLRAMLSTEPMRMSDMLMEDAAMSGEEGVEDDPWLFNARTTLAGVGVMPSVAVQCQNDAGRSRVMPCNLPKVRARGLAERSGDDMRGHPKGQLGLLTQDDTGRSWRMTPSLEKQGVSGANVASFAEENPWLSLEMEELNARDDDSSLIGQGPTHSRSGSESERLDLDVKTEEICNASVRDGGSSITGLENQSQMEGAVQDSSRHTFVIDTLSNIDSDRDGRHTVATDTLDNNDSDRDGRQVESNDSDPDRRQLDSNESGPEGRHGLDSNDSYSDRGQEDSNYSNPDGRQLLVGRHEGFVEPELVDDEFVGPGLDEQKTQSQDAHGLLAMNEIADLLVPIPLDGSEESTGDDDLRKSGVLGLERPSFSILALKKSGKVRSNGPKASECKDWSDAVPAKDASSVSSSSDLSKAIQQMRLSLLRSEKNNLFKDQDNTWFTALAVWWMAPKASLRSPYWLTAVPPGSPEQGGHFVRVLSFHQLREVMAHLRISKIRCDKKNGMSHVPRETMEQHLYTFLNQRFGLKSLVLEWASAIFNAVSKFCVLDIEVTMFGKILLNEIDEEFWEAHRKLKETIIQLLQIYLRGKYSYKNEEDISRMIHRRLHGYVKDMEWIDIIRFMYASEESGMLIHRVDKAERQTAAVKLKANVDCIHARFSSRNTTTRPGKVAKQRPSSKGKVHFRTFLQVLLRHQLEERVKLLKEFRILFYKHDYLRAGRLTRNQFAGLYRDLKNNTKAEGGKNISQMDVPDGVVIPHMDATFSDCVQFFMQDIRRIAATHKE